MILVIGANGNVGSHVVRGLLEAGEPVRALVRDPAKAAKLAGAAIAVGDLAHPQTLGPAFEGISKVFLLSMGPAELEAHAIDAAKAAGVEHVVKLSTSGFGPERDPLSIGRWHRTAEAHLEASGLAWTLLRAGGFSTNTFGWAHSIQTQGAVFAATGEGKVAVVDPRDLAAVAVAVLMGSRSSVGSTGSEHHGKRYELTGPAALSFAEQVAEIAAATGKPLRFVDVPPEVARDALLKGMFAAHADGMLEVMAAIKAGGAAFVSPDVERVLGRKARSFAAWAHENAAAFV